MASCTSLSKLFVVADSLIVILIRLHVTTFSVISFHFTSLLDFCKILSIGYEIEGLRWVLSLVVVRFYSHSLVTQIIFKNSVQTIFWQTILVLTVVRCVNALRNLIGSPFKSLCFPFGSFLL